MKLKKKVKITIIVVSVIAFILIAVSLLYVILSAPVDKNSKAKIEVTIESGMTTKQIANLLDEKNLIRSSTFFLIYLKLNKCDSLKAGTYDLSKNMSISKIKETVCFGKVKDNSIKITFKEGKRLTNYISLISEKFKINEEEVKNTFSDETYLKELINKYWFLTDEILTEGIYYPLEGYLAPDTYVFDKKNNVKEVIEKLLDQTDKILTPYKEKIISSGKSVHYYLTMASITELEGLNEKDRKMIIGVFNNRLNRNMNLGSDVTTYYALQKSMTSDLTAGDFATINPYNTRTANMAGKLPIGPICNPSKISIDASINPTENEYLFFVADKNGKVYYTKTNIEHEQTIKEIKDAGNWIW